MPSYLNEVRAVEMTEGNLKCLNTITESCAGEEFSKGISVNNGGRLSLVEHFWSGLEQVGGAVGIEIPDIKELEVENTIVDTKDLPKHWTLRSFAFYQLAFWSLAAYFFTINYLQARSSSFISLDETSGVCIDDSGSASCCEVPLSVTGEYLADSYGRWNTASNFNFNLNNYNLQMFGVEYTTKEYETAMEIVETEVKALAARGTDRDYAWNLVAWSAFTVINQDSGNFKFYLAGDPGIVYGKDIVAVGFASAVSDSAACTAPVTSTVNKLERTLTVTVDLGCEDWPCKSNPCPGILAPQAMGYDTEFATTPYLTVSVDYASLNVALSVNMGILPLANLVNYAGDSSRIKLLNSMYSAGKISAAIVANTSSYYEPLYAPMQPIYCTTYEDVNGTSCFVRMGNTLVYPVLSHYGWSSTGYDRPTRCTKSAASVSNSAARYYCNKLDLVAGLIYYPVENTNISDALKTATWTPSAGPTQSPTPLPGTPTASPTTGRPTIRRPPSPLPTSRPTLAPSSTPSTLPTSIPSTNPSAAPLVAVRTLSPTVDTSDIAPTIAPTVPPTVSPSIPPTVEPSFAPTSELPSSAPSRSTLSPSPSPTIDPTSIPTREFIIFRRQQSGQRRRLSTSEKDSSDNEDSNVQDSQDMLDDYFPDYEADDNPNIFDSNVDGSEPLTEHATSEDDLYIPDDESNGDGYSSVSRNEKLDTISELKEAEGPKVVPVPEDDYYFSVYEDDYNDYQDLLENAKIAETRLKLEKEKIVASAAHSVETDDSEDYHVMEYLDAPEDDLSYYYYGQGEEGSNVGGNNEGESGGSSQVYYQEALSDDTFVPLVSTSIDNGRIFTFGKEMARLQGLSTQYDIYMATVGYEAMISTLLGSSAHSFTRDFDRICRSSNSTSTATGRYQEANVTVPDGCAMLAVEIYGGDNRVVNAYQYQPSTTPAYSSSLYSARSFRALLQNPPVKLIESYYTCVLGLWPAVLTAIGLANASVQFFITVGCLLYFSLVVFYLRQFKRKEIELLRKKRLRVEKEQEEHDEKLTKMAAEYDGLRALVHALCNGESGQASLLASTTKPLASEDLLLSSWASTKSIASVSTAPSSVPSTPASSYDPNTMIKNHATASHHTEQTSKRPSSAGLNEATAISHNNSNNRRQRTVQMDQLREAQRRSYFYFPSTPPAAQPRRSSQQTLQTSHHIELGVRTAEHPSSFTPISDNPHAVYDVTPHPHPHSHRHSFPPSLASTSTDSGSELLPRRYVRHQSPLYPARSSALSQTHHTHEGCSDVDSLSSARSSTLDEYDQTHRQYNINNRPHNHRTVISIAPSSSTSHPDGHPHLNNENGFGSGSTDTIPDV